MKLSDIKVLEDSNDSGFLKMEVVAGEFTGIKFFVGKISFPDENEPVMQFELSVEGNEPENFEGFKTFVGDFLVGVIEHELGNGSLVFAGGTD